MAPVKRATAGTTQRATRSTRGSEAVKKQELAAEKHAAVLANKVASAGKVVKSTARRGLKQDDTDTVQQDEVMVDEQDIQTIDTQPRSGRRREKNGNVEASGIVTTRNLAVAPRRRIKVTPLDALEPAAELQPKTTRTKSKDTVAVKKSSARTRKVEDPVQNAVTDQPIEQDPAAEVSKTRATRTAKSSAKLDNHDKGTAKARGRPRKADNETAVVAQDDHVKTAPATRATRSRRAESSAVQMAEPAEVLAESAATRNTVGGRKKVTFQDLPNEDDKENLPITIVKSKKTGASTNAASGAAGLRAKPLRKPATASTTKPGTNVTSKVAKTTKKNGDQQAKRMPTALTPKKIMQVAKSFASEESPQISEGEDELNGGKTPVRDLGASPKRPVSSALARALSPAKKLDFGQSLVPQSLQQSKQMAVGGHMASPARRPPPSPFKDGLKDSPKRGEHTKILFPSNSHLDHDNHASIALNPSNISSASHTMSVLLQSPKRSNIVDPGFFSQSALEKSTKKSPFKTSLLASPARRLFSPAKKSKATSPSKISELMLDNDDASNHEKRHEDDILPDESEGDFVASSHFRASVSPVRPLRIDSIGDGVDFDDSVLQFRSPLKVKKTPIKAVSPVRTEQVDDSGNTMVHEPSSETEDGASKIQQRMGDDEVVVDPTQIDITTHSETSLLPNNTYVESQDQQDDVEDDLSTVPGRETTAQKTAFSLSSVPLVQERLFTEPRLQNEVESSEDELAAEETPVRLSTKNRSHADFVTKSRASTGVANLASGADFGFTPLAAQVSEWKAGSPSKTAATPLSRPAIAQRQGSFEFSPLAAQHVDGEVMISRNSTPVQKLKLKESLSAKSSLNTTTKSKRSHDLRKSMADRQSFGLPLHDMPYVGESPARNVEFEEYMEMRALDEEHDEEEIFNATQIGEANRDFDEIMNANSGTESPDQEIDATVLENEDDDDDVPGELTTDLIKFTHASDTAIVDFQKLAEEAEELASRDTKVDNIPCEQQTMSGLTEPSHDDMQGGMDFAVVENDPCISTTLFPDSIGLSINNEDVHETSAIPDMVDSPVLQPSNHNLDSPSILVIDPADSPGDASEAAIEDQAADYSPETLSKTPIKAMLKFDLPRLLNTVTSKVPLKPEGQLSPLKVQRKRARSFGALDVAQNKRRSLSSLEDAARTINHSPDRQTRTSVAPSPGGTSTPVSRHARSSLGGTSVVSTPGQTSFAIDDFGDSTLDGIELPEDYDQTTITQFDREAATPTTINHDNDDQSTPVQPKALSAVTPLISKKGVRRATTPATIKKTPVALTKTPARHSTSTKAARTPLSPVGKGLLDGAVVFVDVHTSEGADASSIFVELLTQMGARCVKDWRWNPRASLAVNTEGECNDHKIGITHVVYKDGGKRTLEKVRDAKGEVCCVGVAWVLDCERESKWLDESIYAIDTSLVPRGGSKRRKSMEPRALLLSEDGSVSASRAKRSVSAEMNELMRRELINTPARGQQQVDDENDDSDEENQDQATPTGYVAYDPRTAMTPGTPYLVSQGKKLIQMSAPPKQTGKRLFDDEEDDQDQENDASLAEETSKVGNGAVKDAKKFRMKNLDIKARRRTLGFKPVVGSPLAKQ